MYEHSLSAGKVLIIIHKSVNNILKEYNLPQLEHKATLASNFSKTNFTSISTHKTINNHHHHFLPP